MERHEEHPGDLELPQKLRNSLHAWQKRIGTGATVVFSVPCPISATNLPAVRLPKFLERHGIEPAPDRKRTTTWKEFLTQHWDMLVAADLFTVEVWSGKGCSGSLLLFFIELSSRKVDRRNRTEPEWSLDESDCPEHHRCRRRNSWWHPLFTAEFLKYVGRYWREVGEAASAISKSKRVR